MVKRRLSEKIYIEHGSPSKGDIAYKPLCGKYGFEHVYGEVVDIDFSETGFVTMKIEPFKHQRRNIKLFEFRFKEQLKERI